MKYDCRKNSKEMDIYNSDLLEVVECRDDILVMKKCSTNTLY